MKTYEHRATSSPALFRVVDRNGNWQFYFFKPSPKSRGRYLRGITTVLDKGLAMSDNLKVAMRNADPVEWERKFRAAGDKGDAVHQIIARILAGEEVNRYSLVLAEDNINFRPMTDAEWFCVLTFERYWTDHDCVLLAHEAAVVNLRDAVAGTLDILHKMRKPCGNKRAQCKCEPFIGLVDLGDWKTGSGIYTSHKAQVAALARCNLSSLIGTNSVGVTSVIRLGTNHVRGYEVQFYDRVETTKNYSLFRSANRQAKDALPMFNPKTDIRDVPEVLTMKVEREDLAPHTDIAAMADPRDLVPASLPEVSIQ